MTVSLGAITLDDNLRLDGVHTSPASAGSARATMGGIVIQAMPMNGGRVLALVATMDGDAVKGVFTQAQLDALVSLRDAGVPVALVHPLYSGQVYLAPDAIDVSQVFDYADPSDDDWYVGTITMITV